MHGNVCVYPLPSMNLLENHFWNEENWSSKYVGVIPRTPQDSEVVSDACLAGVVQYWAPPPSLQLHEVGTAASIRQLTWRSRPTPHYNVILVGLCRFKVEEVRKTTPFLVAKITQLDYISSMYME